MARLDNNLLKHFLLFVDTIAVQEPFKLCSRQTICSEEPGVFHPISDLIRDHGMYIPLNAEECMDRQCGEIATLRLGDCLD